MAADAPREPEGTQLAAQLGDMMGGPEVPADPGKTEPHKCRAVKRGGVDLHCTKDEDHDKGTGATWHQAVCCEHREVTYDGSHHVIDITELVTWEPADEVAEIVRKLGKDRP